MTKESYTILIVEDEMIIAAKISLLLDQLGYKVLGIYSKGEDVLQKCIDSPPDILLLDIRLKGELTGIDTARVLQQNGFEIPIIYLTANFDDETFNKAKETNPYAFISKPFKKIDLQRAIELTISKVNEPVEKTEGKLSEVLNDRVFVKHNGRMTKLMLKDILYAEAERSYCRVKTIDMDYFLSIPLKEFYDKVNNKYLIRVHRSYMINIYHVDEVAKSHVIINNDLIPIGKSFSEEFIHRFQTI